MKKTLGVLLLLATVAFGNATIAAEPTLHDVYQAANAGKLDDAQRMMREVLQAHPQSAKAHYVEAELLAKQGKRQQAAAELATAERLAPGLPFANAQAVASLRQAVGRQATTSAPPASPVPALATPVGSANPVGQAAGMPWGMLLIVLAAVAAFIVWASRRMTRRNAEGASTGAVPAGSGYAQPYPPAAPAGMPPFPGGAAAAAEPGLGSRMLGGLATGAAVGAGVVASQALMHRFLDGHKDGSGNANAAGNGQNNGQNFGSFDDIPSLPSTPLDNLGGEDFGVADGGSWDDGGGGGDDDWN